MKKVPNSTSGNRDRDQTLPRSRILRGKRNFERLFTRSNVLKTSTVQLRYRVYEDPSEGCLVGFIAGRKLGKAARRNRNKRLLREAYRTHQYLLTDIFTSNTLGFHGVFMARQADLSPATVQSEMVSLLKKLQPVLANHDQTDTPVNSRKIKE